MLRSLVVLALFVSSTNALRLAAEPWDTPVFEENEAWSPLELNLKSLGFKKAPAPLKLMRTDSAVVSKRVVTVIDARKREYTRPFVNSFEDGGLDLSSHVALNPSVKASAVVAMAHPRSNDYAFLNKLSDNPDIQVVVHCREWKLEKGGEAHLQLQDPNFNWIVVVDPEFKAGKGSEHVKYLEHMAIFWNQLSDLNFFIHDDAGDKTYDVLREMEKKPHYDSEILEGHMNQMIKAEYLPNFMYLGAPRADGLGWGFAKVNHTGYGSGRCGPGTEDIAHSKDDRFKEMSVNEVFQTFRDECLLAERKGHIPETWGFQNSAMFAVSSSRIREAVPEAASYGRIIKKAQADYTWCDFGSLFEGTWPLLFSNCDDGMFTDTCKMDHGSCQQQQTAGGDPGLLECSTESQ